MNKLKICHISQPVEAGVSTYIYNISKFLNPTKFENYLICPRNGSLPQLCSPLMKQIFFIDMKRSISPLFDLIHLFQIVKVIKLIKPDIIHCHSSKAGILGRIAAKLLSIKCLYSPNAFAYLGYSGIKRKLLWYIEYLMKLSGNYLLSCSRSEYTRAIDELNYTNSKVLLFNNSSYSSKIINVKPAKSTYKVKIMGRNSYQKNLKMFLKTIEIITKTNSNFLFEIIGSGIDEFNGVSLSQIASKLGITNNVKITQWVDYKYLHSVFEDTDILIMTSRYEGLPYVGIDALSYGIPIIGTNVDGVKDLIINNYNGFLVELDDYETMAEKLILLSLNGEYCTFAKNAYKMFDDNFNIKKTIFKLEEIYFSI